jgi:hypothetical protein
VAALLSLTAGCAMQDEPSSEAMPGSAAASTAAQRSATVGGGSSMYPVHVGHPWSAQMGATSGAPASGTVPAAQAPAPAPAPAVAAPAPAPQFEPAPAPAPRSTGRRRPPRQERG